MIHFQTRIFIKINDFTFSSTNATPNPILEQCSSIFQGIRSGKRWKKMFLRIEMPFFPMFVRFSSLSNRIHKKIFTSRCDIQVMRLGKRIGNIDRFRYTVKVQQKNTSQHSICVKMTKKTIIAIGTIRVNI